MLTYEDFKESVWDAFLKTELAEQAFARKFVESKITEESQELIEHIIKVLKWKDDRSYHGHIKSMNGWISKIKRMKISGNKKPKEKNYRDWMFNDIIANVNDVKSIVDDLTPEYGDLKVLRDENTIYSLMVKIFDKLPKDLVDDKFNSIEDYI